MMLRAPPRIGGGAMRGFAAAQAKSGRRGLKTLYETNNVILAGEAVGPFAMNQYIVACKRKKIAAIVDAGSASENFISFAETHGFSIGAIWQTHAHVDHILGLAETKEALPEAPIYLHPADSVFYDNLADQIRMFGMANDSAQPPKWDIDLADGDTLNLGNLLFRVMHTPGHAPGHVIFHCEEDDVLLAGDLLFQGSIGRTDLPWCDAAEMRKSLIRISSLPAQTNVFPGHMGPTTIGTEAASNPFMRELQEP
eukprot:g404.t1